MNPATAMSTVLADELARCGVSEAVLAPGARFTPLVLALDRQDRIRPHVRIDERSASYLALGLAKRSGRPVELRGTGAGQTIDQIGLYGGAVRWFCEVGVPEARVGVVGYWRSLVSRACMSAMSAADPGPVHLNLAFRDPPVPDGRDDWVEPPAGRAGPEPWTADEAQLLHASVSLPPAERGLLVLGDRTADPGPYIAAAESAGRPILAEPTSNGHTSANSVAAYHFLLGTADWLAAHQPDVVVCVGKPGRDRRSLICHSSAFLLDK